MLTAAHRLRSSAEFSSTTRGGVRAAQNTLVVHLKLPKVVDGPAKVGFTVSSAVGGSVVRHRVTRVLRAAASEILGDLPIGSRLVIRALPAAAKAPWPTLRSELSAAVLVAVSKAARR